MSSHGPPDKCQSPLDNKRLNLIPVGRQLQRTPPTKTSTYLSGEPVIKDEGDSQAVTQYGNPGGQDATICASENEERKSYRRSSLTPASAKMGNADPDAFIHGMQGYQWTDADLEFVYQAKQQKRAQQLQQELSEVKKTLQAETQRLELVIASRDQLHSELSKTPSCDSLLQLGKSVLSRSRTCDELDSLDDKALLSLLNLQDVQKAVREENAEIGRLKRQEAKAQELRDKEEKDMKDIENCQNKISTLQANVDALKVQLSELKTQLSEKEGSVVSQVSENSRKGSRRAKTSTKVLKETVPKDTVGKNTVKEGKMAPKEKAPKKMTSKKTVKREVSPSQGSPNETAPKTKALKRTAKKELALDETDLQVNTLKQTASEGTVLEGTAPNVKFSDMTKVLKKGHKESSTAKTSSTTPKKKALKKTTLKELTENKMVLMKTAENGITTTKTPKQSKKTAKKQLAPDETASPVQTPEEMAPEEIATKVKASDFAQVQEKGHKGSRMAKPSTTPLKALKMTQLRETAERETSEVDEKGKRARKVKATKKLSSKKEMASEETVSQLKNLDENVLEEMASKVPEEVSLEETVPKVKVSKPKAPKRMALKKIVDPEMSPEMTATGTIVAEMSSKVRATRNTTLKKTDLKETIVQGMTEEVNALKETFLKKDPKKASKKETAVKNKANKVTDPETTLEKMPPDEEVTAVKTTRKKTTSKIKAPKEIPEKKTETSLRRKASKEKLPKQKAGNNPNEDEESSNATWGSTQQAAEPPKSLFESNPETTRRSKRNTVKNQSLCEPMPEKTTRSRRR